MDTDKLRASIPAQTFRRLPAYYNYLKRLHDTGEEMISSTAIARDLRLGEVQVRKDMAAISEKGGRPRKGFAVGELLACIKAYMGYDRVNEAILVGAGNLGRALLSYPGFTQSGVKIIAAFDSDARLAGGTLFGRQVLPVEKLLDLCGRLKIRIGIIAVPADHAQEICDLMVAAGILAIWNFAPAHLNVPESILVQHENLAISLAMLSRRLEETIM